MKRAEVPRRCFLRVYAGAMQKKRKKGRGKTKISMGKKKRTRAGLRVDFLMYTYYGFPYKVARFVLSAVLTVPGKIGGRNGFILENGVVMHNIFIFEDTRISMSLVN